MDHYLSGLIRLPVRNDGLSGGDMQYCCWNLFAVSVSVDNFKKGLDKVSLIWVDPFDQYGGTTGLVVQSGYSAFTGTLINPGRTGTWGFTSTGPLTRALNTPTNKIGMGCALFANGTTPYTADFNTTGMRWIGGANVRQVTVGGNLQLGVSVYGPSNVLLGSTAPNLLLSGGWTWVEAVCIQNSGGANTGYIEVRINGVQRLVINNCDLPTQFNAQSWGGFFGGFTMDDILSWDGAGTVNNTFMSDRRLSMCLPNANSALQDFTPSAGSAFNCVNVVPPVDTTYIEGAAAGNVSEFTKAGIPLNSTDIAAVVAMGRMFKTDAGVASGRVGINSSANVLNSPAFNPGTTGTWFQFPVELNPNGNIPWTKAAADAALLRVTRDT